MRGGGSASGDADVMLRRAAAGPAAALDAAVEEGLVPVVAAGAATRDGVRFEGACGGAATDSLFWVAMMTELATAVLALALVEDGVLPLHGPLGALLPELASPQVLEGFSRAGEPILRPATRPVTLHQLLTHTAGVGYEFWDATLLRFRRDTGTPSVLEHRLAGLGLPLVFDPGQRWLYGMSGDWVGRAVEAATGRTLAEAMAERVLRPLGMADTGFAPGDGQAARLVPTRRRSAEGAGLAEEPCPAGLPVGEDAYRSGGSGLFSTVGDMLRLTRMLLGRGELDGARVLRADTVRAMATHQIGGLRPAVLPAPWPEMSCAVALPSGEPGWGIGGLVDVAPCPGGRGVGTLSWGGISNTFFWVDAARGVCGVLLAPLLPFADPGALAASRSFEAAVYAALPGWEARQG
ncbi:MAG: serine hydrolase domain-containing protein [Janthinobacterium lividum]